MKLEEQGLKYFRLCNPMMTVPFLSTISIARARITPIWRVAAKTQAASRPVPARQQQHRQDVVPSKEPTKNNRPVLGKRIIKNSSATFVSIGA